MTDAATTTVATSTGPTPVSTAPPFSRALRIAAGLCLIAGGLLNGLPQAIGHVLTGGIDFSEQIAWGAEHPLAHGIEQTALVVSSLVMPLGLLGVAHVCRFRAPVLTAIATPLVLWGMWGFGNVLAMGYVAGTVAPSILDVGSAVRLNDGLVTHQGVVATALVPHLIGSFLGLILLSVAAWRSRAFPRTAVVLLVAFLVWDFALEPVGPVDAHILLVLAWGLTDHGAQSREQHLRQAPGDQPAPGDAPRPGSAGVLTWLSGAAGPCARRRLSRSARPWG